MIVSDKRIRANRANAQKSTGPRTRPAQARSTSNAQRYDWLAKQILITGETPTNFRALFDLLIRRFEPVDDFEIGMIEELAATYWRLRRTWAVETELFHKALHENPARHLVEGLAAAYNGLASGKTLDLLHQEENRLHKMYQRSLQNLLLVRQLATHVPEIFSVNEPISTFDINESSPGESHSNPLEATFAGTPSEPPALLPAAPDLSAKPAGAA
jgi:hypothetical protein